ncbi:hypothetical protein JMJ35_010651 [Cladonia borealis]|uniref:Uncharacterized protein n=1 Tax=Cladonia borealis TaxID=184061 RepID=A0AA39U3G6_9LECA|nr:hypothetical protein JMJ35_010651 [Cladonia borealis]
MKRTQPILDVLIIGNETITLELVAIELHENVEDGYFEVIDKHRKVWVGKKVPLATGVRVVYPDTEGYVVYEQRAMIQYPIRHSSCARPRALPTMHFARNVHPLTQNGVTI